MDRIHSSGDDEHGAWRVLVSGDAERQCWTCLTWLPIDALVVGPYGVNCLACEEMASADAPTYRTHR